MTDTGDAPGATTRKATLRCAFCLTLNRVDLGRAEGGPRCGKCARPMLVDRPVKVSGEDLGRLVEDAEVPILVDFYADWCAPCKVMAPVLDDLAHDRVGTLVVAKLDTDRHPEISRRFGIRGIPTLILFRDGKEATRRTGAVPRETVESMLQEG